MNNGFFKNSHDPALYSRIKLTGCSSCGLSLGCLHPKMEPTGQGQKKILFLAEGPGEDEDRLGVQLIGRVGQRLRRTIQEMGFDLDKDCRKTNAVRCRPPENRTPTGLEISQCRNHIFEEIEKSKPQVIIPLGGSAVLSLLGDRWKRNSDFTISRWRGLTIPDHELGAWVCPTFHPSYVERSDNYAPAVDVIWKRDLKRALDLCGTPLPKKPDPDIRMLKGKQIEEYLLGLWRRGKSTDMVKTKFPFAGLTPGTEEWMIYWKNNRKQQRNMLMYQRNPVLLISPSPLTIAFDYETTGLKPYREGHKILCCSIAESPDLVNVWMWSKGSIPMFNEVMKLGTILKIAGNIKFEHIWTRQMCRSEIQGWWWDTVVAGKTLDHRPGNSNVKFQAYSRLGIIDYDSRIQPFISSTDGTSNGFNRLHEVPSKELMEYCAMDSALEYGIALDQRKEMGYA